MVRLFIFLAAFTAIQECVATVIPMQCPAGFHRINATSNLCMTCPDRTYAKASNSELTCHDCTTCSWPWPKIINECTATHDVVCGCYEGYVLSTDGCVRETADQDPRLNFTASVERIVKYLEYLRTTLNDTHDGIILDTSRELKKLNQSLFGVLYRIETRSIQIAQSESSKLSNLTGLNQMLEKVSNTDDKAILTYGLSGTILAFLLSSLLVNYVLVWKGKQYFSNYVLQIGKALFDNEVPCAPRNLRHTSVTSTSLFLAWDAPTCSSDSGSPNMVISGYKLYYTRGDIGPPKEVQIHKGCTHKLTNLQPNTDYAIYVKAFSNDVDGQPSNTEKWKTLPDNTQKDGHTRRDGPASRPAGAPQNLHRTRVTSTSLSLAWDAPTDSGGPNMVISFYTVCYASANISPPIEVEIHGFCKATLTNLQPDTTYVIYVKAFSNDVNGQPSNTLTEKTVANVTQIKEAVCGDDDDGDLIETSLNQMIKTLLRLTIGTELEVEARAVKKAFFGEDSPQDAPSSILNRIEKIIARANEIDLSPKKEEIIKTAQQIKTRIFGNGNAGESTVMKTIKNVFEDARGAFNGILRRNTAKIQRMIDRGNEGDPNQADYENSKITRALEKVSSCRELKIMEVTRLLMKKLCDEVPDVRLEDDVQLLLQQLRTNNQESVRMEVEKIDAALGGGQQQTTYQQISVAKFVRKLASCSNGLPFRSRITELENHLFGKLSLRHTVTSLVFDEQQQEISNRLSKIEESVKKCEQKLKGVPVQAQ